MSDIDWKARCKKVAEWLGHLRRHTEVRMSQEGLAAVQVFYESEDRDEYWPDYTRDDAAAWRLHKAIANQRFVFGSDGSFSPANRGQMLKQHAGIFRSVETWEKAQVLAACELVDEGVEPGSAR